MAIKKLFLISGLIITFNSIAAIADNITTPPILPPVGSITPNVAASTNLIPQAPDLNVKAYVLLDAKSGNVIAAKNPDEQLPPASLTKIMSLYLIADALKSGKITLNDPVLISEKAWRMEGSRMFAKVGSSVPLQDMVNGIIIASGNDATVAMAEHVAGSEEAFVDLMNQTSALLNLKNTHFSDSNGLPAANHFSSARDIALLSRAWINNFPEYFPWFKTKWISYNGIKQPNRNRLLWRDQSVDGIKTGHTKDAGYCLSASAERNNARLVAVVLGAPSDKDRANYAGALLNYGFRFFESHKLYAVNTAIATPKVRYGKEKTARLGLNEDLYITIPTGQFKKVKIQVSVNNKLQAPIHKGQAYGTITITVNDNVIDTRSLVALRNNPKGGIWKRLLDKIWYR